MTTITDHFSGKTLAPRVPSSPPQTTVLGVAVGDLSVRPSLCAVRYHHLLISPGDPIFGELPTFETHYTLIGAESLDAGLGYPAVASRVNRLAQRLYARDSRGDYHALIDASDAGRPVIAAIRDAVIPACTVTGVRVTTGDTGDESILWRRETSVGLSYLISRLQAILQGGRLHVPDDAVSHGLLDLLRTYDIQQSSGADLVRALALACSSEYHQIRYGPSPDSLPSAL
jgi:hypothetical protein